MPTVDKWSKYEVASPPKTADKWSRYEVGAASPDPTVPTQDLTSNPQGEGLYRMSQSSPGVWGDAPEIQVPYSRVNDAISSGYRVHPDDTQRFQKDQKFQGQGPTLRERAGALFNDAIQTSPTKTSSNPADVFDLSNLFKSALRTVVGLPGYASDVVQAARTGARDNNAALMNLLDPGSIPPQLLDQYHSDSAKYGAPAAAQNLVGALAGMYAAGKAAGKATGALQSAGDAIGSKPASLPLRAAKIMTGTGPRGTGELVREVQGENAASATAADAKNAALAQSHLIDTQDALHETAGREIQYQQAVDAANQTAAEAQKALDAQHLNAVQSSLEETRQKEDLYQNDLKNAAAESDAAYQKELAKVQQKRAAQEQSRKSELSDYFAQKEAIRAKNQSDIEGFRKLQAQQQKVAPTQAKLQTTWRGLLGSIETARVKASKVGNQKYNGVNDALNPYEADPEKIRVNLADAAESVSSPKLPAILKEFADRMNGTHREELEAGRPKEVPNDPITYDDLQGFYSKLGNALSKGTLDGETYHAYDMMHDAIGDEMQRIADEHGQGSALTEARNYWRLMKQAFGKPLNAGDVATKTLSTAVPDAAAAEAQANRVRLLGAFDSSIPGQFTNLSNIQKGIESLPKENTAREVVRKMAESRKPAPTVPLKPAPIPEPQPVMPSKVAQPSRVDIPDRPAAVSVKLPEPPARVSPPDRPQTVNPTVRMIGPEDIRARKLSDLQTKANQAGGIGSRALDWRMIQAGGAITEVLGMASGSGLAKLAGATALSAPFVMEGYARFLERPGVAQRLSKITTSDIAKVPPELRTQALQDLAPILDAAKRKGIRIDPVVAGMVGALSSAPRRSRSQQ